MLSDLNRASYGGIKKELTFAEWLNGYDAESADIKTENRIKYPFPSESNVPTVMEVLPYAWSNI